MKFVVCVYVFVVHFGLLLETQSPYLLIDQIANSTSNVNCDRACRKYEIGKAVYDAIDQSTDWSICQYLEFAKRADGFTASIRFLSHSLEGATNP